MVVKQTLNALIQNIMLLGLLVPGILLSGVALASDTKLNASVDRNKIYETDTLNLILSGEIAIDISFGGLMNFSRSQLATPELSILEDDFEILDQQQQYNMKSINGQSTSEVTWRYTLAPKRSGTLVIPQIEYQGASSEAISIEVLPGKAPVNADNPPQVFLEVEVDKTSAYVQEQVMYTLRLYASDHLASGDLSDPAPIDAIVEKLGDDNKYFRMAYNQRYEVIERKYLLFPQKSGELVVPAQSFNGLLIDTRSRNRVRVRENSEQISLNIKPPAASFSGQSWLPATSLELSEKWDGQPESINVGDSLTRIIEINALGLLGSALPPLPLSDISGMKVYPDQPVVDSYEHDSGVQSLRRETYALVAVQSSQTQLPEIRIPWWDTVNDVERIAVIPARPLIINTGGASAAIPDTPTVQSSQANLDTQVAPDNTANLAEVEALTPGDSLASTNSANTDDSKWYAVIILLLFGWLSTTFLLLRRASLGKTQSESSGVAQNLQTATLIQAVKADDANMPRLLLDWLSKRQHRSAELPPLTLSDIATQEPVLYQSLSAFEAFQYAEQSLATRAAYDKKLVLARIRELDKTTEKTTTATPLQAFYP